VQSCPGVRDTNDQFIPSQMREELSSPIPRRPSSWRSSAVEAAFERELQEACSVKAVEKSHKRRKKSKRSKRQMRQDVEVAPVDVKRIERLLGKRFRRG